MTTSTGNKAGSTKSASMSYPSIVYSQFEVSVEVTEAQLEAPRGPLD